MLDNVCFTKHQKMRALCAVNRSHVKEEAHLYREKEVIHYDTLDPLSPSTSVRRSDAGAVEADDQLWSPNRPQSMREVTSKGTKHYQQYSMSTHPPQIGFTF